MDTNDGSSKDLTQDGGPRRRPWVKKAVAGCIVIVILGLSAMAGYFIWKATRPSSGSGATALTATQLPPPGSAAAKALLADPNTPQNIRDLYQAADDATNITPKDTEAFLIRLQAQLLTLGYDFDLTLFVDLANQVVHLLRLARADALLTLLRQYAQTGSLTLESIDLDQLQREVNSVLQAPAWDTYFRYTSVRDVSTSNMTRDWDNAFPDRRTAPPPAGLPPAAQQVAATTGGGRRLKLQQTIEHGLPRHGTTWRRRLAAAAAIPVITASEDADGVLPTTLPPQTLDDMLCKIAPFAGGPVDTSKCKPRATGWYSHAGVTFRPVTIPVVFHCMRFIDSNDILQPPFWDPVKDATHLIAATNAKYLGTGISFSLKEVRWEPAKHAYLLMDMMDWLSCAPHPTNDMSCLSKIMAAHGDSTYAVNIIINGANSVKALCSTPAAQALCNAAYLGYANTRGPWFPAGFALADWTEDALEMNWAHITWEYFSPTELNSAARNDGGAATLAHELGHYLGLRHTHEGRECEGDGVEAADAVPDTPMNIVVEGFALELGLSRALGQFCSNWRAGKPTDTTAILRFNSCKRPEPGSVDNVFNVMSYQPDQCFFTFTENQAARMQWAIATFRPKLMARYA